MRTLLRSLAYSSALSALVLPISRAQSQQLILGGGSAASGLFGSSVPLGGDVSNSIVTAPGETSGRSVATQAGDVYNLADHGADGTAANDDAALNKAIAFATLRDINNSGGAGTTIYLPQNIQGMPWQFTASSLFTFGFPSNTVFKGSGINSTTIAWNDNNTGNLPANTACQPYATNNPGTVCGYYLFGSATDTNPGSARTQNLTFQDFKIIGTWTTIPTGGSFAAGNTALFPNNVDGLTIRNVESDYSRGFGMGTKYSTNVFWTGDEVDYSYADGISSGSSSNVLGVNLKINHTNDDCWSDHTNIGEPEMVRRNVTLVGVTCFDTASIKLLSATNVMLSDITMDSPKDVGISINTIPSGGGGSEGLAAAQGVILTDITVKNMLQRNGFDNYSGGDDAIELDGQSARGSQSASGNVGAVPGESILGQTSITDPYPYTFSNSNSATVPTRAANGIVLNNILVERTFGATTTTALPNWQALGQGPITGSTAFFNPSLPESNLEGNCVTIGGYSYTQYIDDISINGLHCHGMGRGVSVIEYGYDTSAKTYTLPGNIGQVSIRDSDFYDLTQQAIYVNVNAQSNAFVKVTNSHFNMDPYDKNPCRAAATTSGIQLAGSWSSSAASCGSIPFYKDGAGGGSLLATGNTIMNAPTETNVDPTDPTTGWLFERNFDMGTFNSPNAASTSAAPNYGVGFPHTAGFEPVPMDATPGDQAYGAITSTPVEAAAAVPTTGTWYAGKFVRNTAVSNGNPVYGWYRATNGTSDVLNVDWLPVTAGPNLRAVPQPPTLVQSTSQRNADSSTSATVTFPNTVQTADTVLVVLVGGSSNQGATMPAACTLLAQPGVATTTVNGNQTFKVWQCPAGITYTVGSLTDGALIQGMEVSTYVSALVTAAPVSQSTTTLTVPVTGQQGDLRLGVVEWDGSGATTTVTPSSVPITNYPAGSDNYHYGFSYVAPQNLTLASLTATTGYTVVNPTYVQIDIQSRIRVSAQAGAYTLQASDCDTKIWDTGATAAHTFTVPPGICVGGSIDAYQATTNTLTIAQGTGETVHGVGSLSAQWQHARIDFLTPTTGIMHP